VIPPNLSHVDSGAGQSMFADCAAFLDGSLQSCFYTIEGVIGNTAVTTFGTADLCVQDNDGISCILRIANYLMNPCTHNFIGLSHLQTRPEVEVFLTNTSPRIIHTDAVRGTVTVVPLTLDNGTYVCPSGAWIALIHDVKMHLYWMSHRLDHTHHPPCSTQMDDLCGNLRLVLSCQ